MTDQQLRNRIWDEAKARMLAAAQAGEYAGDPQEVYEILHNIVDNASEQAERAGEERAFSDAMERVEDFIER